jgi:cytochrome c-type biogenesis protein
MVPIYLTYILKTSLSEIKEGDYSIKHLFVNTTFFSFGYVSMFILAFVLVSVFSSFISIHQSFIYRFFGLMLIILGILQLTKIKISIKSPNFKNFNFVSYFILGVFLAVTSIPCIGPTLAVVIYHLSTQNHFYQGLISLLLYSVGMVIPFYLFPFFINFVLNKTSQISKISYYLNKLIGVVFIVIGVLMLSGYYSYIIESIFPHDMFLI